MSIVVYLFEGYIFLLRFLYMIFGFRFCPQDAEKRNAKIYGVAAEKTKQYDANERLIKVCVFKRGGRVDLSSDV